MAQEGQFILGVQIQGVAEELAKLKTLEDAANRVATKLNSLGRAKKVAAKLGFTKDLEKSFTDINKISEKVVQATKRQQESIKKLTASYRESIKDVKRLTAEQIKAGSAGKNAADRSTKSLKGFNNQMTVAISKIIRYRLAFGAWREITDLMRGAVDVTIEMNQTIVNLEKVMNPVVTNFDLLRSSSFNFGVRFGQSALDVAESMRVWAQQGKALNEVIALTQATLLGVTAANLSAHESVEALTAATKAYNIEAIKSPEIVDRWLAVQANFAVTAQDLANAVKAIGPAARVSGVDIDQLNGVVAAIGSVTRKTGREVANSFKTILARLNRLPAIKQFQQLGIAVRASREELRSVPAVLEDLNKQWGSLEDGMKRNIAITVGGIRRYTDFIALMENFDTFTEAAAISFNSLGKATLASALQVQSYTGQLQSAKTQISELGVALGEAGILQVVLNVTNAFANASKSISDNAEGWVKAAKIVTLLVGTVGTAAVVFTIFKVITGLLAKSVAKAQAVLALEVKSFQAVSVAATEATIATSTFGKALAGLGKGVAVFSAIGLGIWALIELFDLLFDKIELVKDGFGTTRDQILADIEAFAQERDTYQENVDLLKKLIKEKERFIAASKFETPEEKEADAIRKLTDIYGKEIVKIVGLIKSINETDTTFKLDDVGLGTELLRQESDLSESNKRLRLLGTLRVKDLQNQADAMVGIVARTNIRLDDLRNEQPSIFPEGDIFEFKTDVSTNGKFNVTTKNIRKVWLNLINGLREDIVTANLDDELIKQYDSATDALKSGEVGINQFKTNLEKIFSTFQGSVTQAGVGLQKDINAALDRIATVSRVKLLPADSLFTVDGAATKLQKKLISLNRQTKLFDRDNRGLARTISGTGLAYNTAANGVQFFQNKLKELFKLRTQQQSKLAAAERALSDAEKQNTSQDTLNNLENKIKILRIESASVVAGTKPYQDRARQIEQTFNIERARLLGSVDQNVSSGKQIAAVNAEVARLQGIANDKVAEQSKLINQLVARNAYSEIESAIKAATIRLKEFVGLQIQSIKDQSSIDSSYRAILNSTKEQISLLKLAGASEESILNFKNETIEAQIKELNGRKALSAKGTDEIKIQQQILKLRQDQEKLTVSREALDVRRKILKLQASISLETSKGEAINEILLSQISNQADAEFKILALSKERTKVQSQLEASLLKSRGLGEDDAKITENRKKLAKNLLDIEKNILLARVAIVKEYKDNLSQVSSELGSLLSTNFGSFTSRQRDAYEEIGDLQQDIVDAERDRQIALKSGDEEGIFDATRSLNDLLAEQEKLNSATRIWGDILSDVGNQFVDLVNERLSDQFFNNILDISLGEDTLGQTLSKGIIFRPSLAEFEVTAQKMDEVFTSSLQEGGVFVGSEIRKALKDEIDRLQEIKLFAEVKAESISTEATVDIEVTSANLDKKIQEITEAMNKIEELSKTSLSNIKIGVDSREIEELKNVQVGIKLPDDLSEIGFEFPDSVQVSVDPGSITREFARVGETTGGVISAKITEALSNTEQINLFIDNLKLAFQEGSETTYSRIKAAFEESVIPDTTTGTDTEVAGTSTINDSIARLETSINSLKDQLIVANDPTIGSATGQSATNIGLEKFTSLFETSGEKVSKNMANSVTKAAGEAAAIKTKEEKLVDKIAADRQEAIWNSGVKLLGNTLGQAFGGGGPLSQLLSSFGSLLSSDALLGGALGLVGGIIGGLFDTQPKTRDKPIFDDVSASNPLPVQIEGFGNQATQQINEVSIVVEASFLDASQLDPITTRNLAILIREETERLFARENIGN